MRVSSRPNGLDSTFYSNIGFTNNLFPNSILIDVFKETAIHLEVYCTMEEINKIRLFFTNKVTKYKKKAQNMMKEIPNQEKRSMISVTLSSLKKEKSVEQDIIEIFFS